MAVRGALASACRKGVQPGFILLVERLTSGRASRQWLQKAVAAITFRYKVQTSKRDILHDRHIVANAAGLANHHARAVVQQQPLHRRTAAVSRYWQN